MPHKTDTYLELAWIHNEFIEELNGELKYVDRNTI